MTAVLDDPWVGAACREPGIDAELFFPGQGDAGAADAKAVCRRCRLQRTCFAYAMDREAQLGDAHRHGIWGGTSAKERERLGKRWPR